MLQRREMKEVSVQKEQFLAAPMRDSYSLPPSLRNRTALIPNTRREGVLGTMEIPCKTGLGPRRSVGAKSVHSFASGEAQYY